MSCFVILVGCGGAALRPAGGEVVAIPWQYVIRLERDTSVLDVSVCFDDEPPRSMTARGRLADYAPRAVRPSDSRAWDLDVEDRTVSLDDLQAGDCIEYSVPFTLAIARAVFERSALFSAWDLLWCPVDGDGHPWAARFVLPEGIKVSTPWLPTSDGAYQLSGTAFQRLSHLLIGSFIEEEVPVPGAAVVIGGHLGPHQEFLVPGPIITVVRPHELGALPAKEWIFAAGTAAAELFGEFPVERAQVILVPANGVTAEPVPFGLTGNGGGASIVLVVQPEAELEALKRDWVATHEFVHLALPWTQRSDAWFGEGIATYYQEVLRARAGLQTELEAWRALDDGFRRGAEEEPSEGSLEEESEHMFESRTFRRVYWSGAALALVSDVALRRGGHGSLDDALLRLRARCKSGLWDAQRLLSLMDEQLREPFLRPLADVLLHSSSFPELHDLYDYLGLRLNPAGELVLDDSAEGALIRRAIMAAYGVNH